MSGAITLADPDTGNLRIEASFGFSPTTAEGIQFRPGEGITGLVFQSGKAIVVPKIGEEPLFLDRSKVRRQGRKVQGS